MNVSLRLQHLLH